MYYNGAWGTVCDDFWSTADARVVCKQLGYESDGVIAYSRAEFGQGTGDIILDNLSCSGSEASIFDCTHNGEGVHNCGHSEDAGVFCPIPGIPQHIATIFVLHTYSLCSSIKLAGYTYPKHTYVNLLHNNIFFIYCASYFSYLAMYIHS